MKGYLQRMVAGVARPARTVHPLVGGLFLKDPQPGIVEESAVVRAQDGPRWSDGDIEARRDVGESEEPKRLVGEPLQPLVERGVREKMSPQMRGRIRRDGDEIVASVEEFVAHQSANAEHGPIPTLRVHTLLMPEGADGDRGDPIEKPSVEGNEHRGAEVSRVARTAGERLATERAERQDGQRGSEDIQIHIGRIEVIAVPSPVQRAANAVTRKSESLEEYLGRRDRRTR